MTPRQGEAGRADPRWSRFALTPLVAALIAATAVVGVGTADEKPGPKAVTMDAIKQAYQKRQDRVRSARFVWTKRFTEARGSLSELYNVLAKLHKTGGEKAERIIPPVDTTQEFASRLELDGENACHQSDGKVYSPDLDAYITEKYSNAFYQGTGKTLTFWDPRHHPRPQGSIRKEPHFFNIDGADTIPLRQHYRAMSDKLRAYDLDHYTVTGRQAVIEGVRCTELQWVGRGGRFVERLWLAPEQDYSMIRTVYASAERVLFQLTVQYREDRQHGWLPIRWGVISNNDEGRTKYSTSSVVHEFEINPTIPTSTFDLKFPPSTTVIDQRTGKDYVIKPSGEKREILLTEVNAPYEELITTDPGGAAKHGRPISRFWTNSVIVSIALLAFAIYIFRRVRRRWHPRSAPPTTL